MDADVTEGIFLLILIDSSLSFSVLYLPLLCIYIGIFIVSHVFDYLSFISGIIHTGDSGDMSPPLFVMAHFVPTTF